VSYELTRDDLFFDGFGGYDDDADDGGGSEYGGDDTVCDGDRPELSGEVRGTRGDVTLWIWGDVLVWYPCSYPWSYPWPYPRVGL
jgi:hypothetical protein